ncbi:VanZ family protein [Actinosynnema pretiosum]|uniref:VanZ family protein n=1 Tax=Actinosynnema pretiosum TaxID=42197 RepID=UPI0012FDC659|nr:VanZ family protein [Actinosynnema pretiosum]
MGEDLGYAGVGIESWYALLPALALFAVVLAVRVARRAPGWTGRGAVLRAVTALYLAGVAHFTLFPIDWGAGNLTPWHNQLQPIPLLTADLPTFALNVVMLVPFGVLLPLLDARVTRAGQVAVRALGFSAVIEVAQLVVYLLARSGRSVDVDDLIANTVGAVLGFLLLRAVPGVAARWRAGAVARR